MLLLLLLLLSVEIGKMIQKSIAFPSSPSSTIVCLISSFSEVKDRPVVERVEIISLFLLKINQPGGG